MGSDARWTTGHLAPVHDERDDGPLPTIGTLPTGLRGTFLRNGPNPAFTPLGRYHLFDGDGMVHAVAFDGEGGARYRNRWIRSAGLEAERRAGRALFGGLSDFRMPPPEIVAQVGALKNTANTHVVAHAGRILALMEAARPTEITLGLDTVGEHDFGGALAGPMTAHPKVDPITGEMVFFGYSPVPPHLRVHAADAEGQLVWSTEVPIPRAVMMHDFAITATKVVLFDLPATFHLDALLRGGEAIAWEPDAGARIGLLERGAAGATTRLFDLDPFWMFHLLNAYDDEDGTVVVHGCRADELNVGFAQDLERAAPPCLHRWRIDPARGTVTDRQLDDHPSDFPRVDERRTGQRARHGFVAHAQHWDLDQIAFDAVARHDLDRGTRQVASYGPGALAGEPVFAPDLDASDDTAGWVLNFVHDTITDTSSVVVLDADTLEHVASVPLPRRVPFGFHGSFVADP